VLNVIFFCIFEFVWGHNIRNWWGSDFLTPPPSGGGFIVDLQKCPVHMFLHHIVYLLM